MVIFKVVEFGVPLLLFSYLLYPADHTGLHFHFFRNLYALIIILWFLKKNWLRLTLTLTLYLLVPLIVYLSAADTRLSESRYYINVFYNYSFVFLVFFVVLTLKFTRRRRGFKVTPMDFLILFIALIAPYLAGMYMAHKEIGTVAAKTIMLFFSYEVLIGELRGHFDKLTFMTICSLIALTARGFLGA